MKAPIRSAFLALLALAGSLTLEACASPAAREAVARGEVVWLDTLDLDAVKQGWGTARRNRSVEGNRLTIGDATFSRGIGTHAWSQFLISIDGAARSFDASIGVDLEVAAHELPGSVVFQVFVDGRKAFESDVLSVASPAGHVQVDLTGAKTLMLMVTDAGDGNGCDHADWANARIELLPDRKLTPGCTLGRS